MWVVNYVKCVNSGGSHNNVAPLPEQIAKHIFSHDKISCFKDIKKIWTFPKNIFYIF